MLKPIKYFLLMISFTCIRGQCLAQQDPVYSQYMYSLLAINPAYAGNREVLSVSSILRSQWRRIEGGPQTQLLFADGAIRNKKMGLGIQVFNDETAVIKNTGVYGMYSYRIPLKHGLLSFGIQVGALKFKADYASLLLDDYTDPAFTQNQNEFRLNFGTGVFFNTDKFYMGLSVPHLAGQRRVNVTQENSKIYEQNNHWFLTAGRVFDLNPDLSLKTSLLLRAVTGAPLHADVTANLWFLNVASVGVSYRTSESMVAMMEWQVNQQFRIGYAYDFTFNALGNQSTNEIILRYEFGYSKRNLMSPRFF